MEGGRCMDTSDPRQFGTISLVPKCLTFLCQCRSVSTFYEGAEVYNGQQSEFPDRTSLDTLKSDVRGIYGMAAIRVVNG